MTAKEKAKELYDKMLQWQTDANIYIQRNITSISAKKTSLITVDEIIKSKPYWDTQEEFEYWYEVKQEIEKL